MVPLLDLSERLQAARDAPAAWAATTRALQAVEVAWCFHAHVVGPSPAAQRPAAVQRFSTLPDAWTAHHAAQRYWTVDASLRHCARSVAVLATGEEMARAAGDLAWARMCADAQAAGIGCGLTVPLRGGPGGGFGGFALLTRERGARFAAWRAAQGPLAVLMALAAAQRLLALAGPAPAAPPLRLARRERECLLWLTTGLRSDRIAERLGVTRATVDLHLARARRRLGAATREQAVARALSLGLLDP